MRTRRPNAAYVLAPLLATIAIVLASCAKGPSLPNLFGGGGGNTNSSAGNANKAKPAAPVGPTLQVLTFTDTLSPAPGEAESGISVAAARNEWTSFSLQLASLPKDGAYTLRVRPPQSGGNTIPAAGIETYQILKMPVDVNRAGYVRHTGQSAAMRDLPRALLPVGNDNGLVNLKALRDPGNAPMQLWVDLHVPNNAPAGDYASTCDLISTKTGKAV